MAQRRLKVSRVGNSRGVRIPANTLKRYEIGAEVLMEERSDGILLRPTGNTVQKLSWAETAIEIARSNEDWSDWDTTSTDGLEEIEWRHNRSKRVAEKGSSYERRSRRKK